MSHDVKAERPDLVPPLWAGRFLRWYCRPDLAEDLEGDLQEYFLRNATQKGLQRAKLIYVLDVFKFIRPYTLKKPKPLRTMVNFNVFRNYFKTSARTLYRNKLFSGINIIGLAISMSVGLLLIAFLAEIASYDSFHKGYDRIYRVTSTYQRSGWDASNYASTSILAGRKIQDLAPGIESMTILRGNWDKDLHLDDKTVPLKGIWADPGFFRVFSWNVLQGDPESALNSLNSVVLTASAATKLFGTVNVLGKHVLVDTINYSITAVVEDPPLNSHLRFEMVGSLITLDTRKIVDKDKNWMRWDYIWQNYVYLKLKPDASSGSLFPILAGISETGNRTLENERIEIGLQPLRTVVLGPDLSNQIGPSFPSSMAWILGGLAIIVILSACFNYTNLSIARALRRTREIGVRKVIGATRVNVLAQFLFESVLISFVALFLSFGIFVLLRPGFISLDRVFSDLVTLQPTNKIYVYFLAFAVLVGLLAGLVPALFFSRLNSVQILKNTSGLKLFGHLGLRKALVVFQYALSLGLIVAVSLGFRQYRFALTFDLGLATENILNVDLQQNKPDVVMRALATVPGVVDLSRSIYVPNTGMQWSGNILFLDPKDSATLYYNYVDTSYLRLHGLQLVAGRNFSPGPSENIRDAGIIINERAVHWMGLADPHQAVGQEVRIDGEKITVVGVVKDFHYASVTNPIDNFALRYYAPTLPARWGGVVNLRIQTNDPQELMAAIEKTWKAVDPVHPLKASFYEERIRKTYDELIGLTKIMGILAFLAISIAFLGLLGMVVFTTETRLKEISIRKVMGASEKNLVLLMSHNFLLLLFLAALIAIPSTYLLFDKVVFSNIAYRAPTGFIDLFGGSLAVVLLATLAIGSQTLRVARVNPASTLRNE